MENNFYDIARNEGLCLWKNDQLLNIKTLSVAIGISKYTNIQSAKGVRFDFFFFLILVEGMDIICIMHEAKRDSSLE